MGSFRFLRISRAGPGFVRFLRISRADPCSDDICDLPAIMPRFLEANYGESETSILYRFLVARDYNITHAKVRLASGSS